jgi:hypothetical protein
MHASTTAASSTAFWIFGPHQSAGRSSKTSSHTRIPRSASARASRITCGLSALL